MTPVAADVPKSIDLPTIVLVLRDDGLLVATNKPGTVQTLEDARENVEGTRSLGLGRRPPLLVDMRESRGMERAARAYYAGPEGEKVVCAIGLLVGSPATRIIGNFFIGLNRVLVPCKLFSDEEDAVAWLRGFLP
ncbi:MAG: hypothetical protein IT371_27200 [Deltaproteobacteria bacterium]|nr:hypothetical protein [Deltaproteobacteria bacterium]